MSNKVFSEEKMEPLRPSSYLQKVHAIITKSYKTRTGNLSVQCV